MKCTICKHGDTISGFTTITLEKNNSTIVFKEVPAKICDNCEEVYIEDEITTELLKKARTIIKNGVEIDIRKYGIAA